MRIYCSLCGKKMSVAPRRFIIDGRQVCKDCRIEYCKIKKSVLENERKTIITF